jgi:hypothetical protein
MNALLLFPSLAFEFKFKYPSKIKDFLVGGAPKPLSLTYYGRVNFFLASRFKLCFWSTVYRSLFCFPNFSHLGLLNFLYIKIYIFILLVYYIAQSSMLLIYFQCSFPSFFF